MHIAQHHVGFTVRTDVEHLEDQLVAAQSAADHGDILHHVFCEAVARTAQRLFFFRFFYGARRIGSGVQNDNLIQSLHEQRHQPRVELRKCLQIAVVGIIGRQLVRTRRLTVSLRIFASHRLRLCACAHSFLCLCRLCALCLFPLAVRLLALQRFLFQLPFFRALHRILF